MGSYLLNLDSSDSFLLSIFLEPSQKEFPLYEGGIPMRLSKFPDGPANVNGNHVDYVRGSVSIKTKISEEFENASSLDGAVLT